VGLLGVKGVKNMSRSTHVLLLRDKNDETYKKNLRVFEACKEANVQLPKKISDYFGNYLNEFPLEINFKPREWKSDQFDEEGYEIDIDSLPEGVTIIRFYHSY